MSVHHDREEEGEWKGSRRALEGGLVKMTNLTTSFPVPERGDVAGRPECWSRGRGEQATRVEEEKAVWGLVEGEGEGKGEGDGGGAVGRLEGDGVFALYPVLRPHRVGGLFYTECVVVRGLLFFLPLPGVAPHGRKVEPQGGQLRKEDEQEDQREGGLLHHAVAGSLGRL